MTEREFRAAYPIIFDWIQRTLAAHASEARAVNTYNLPRLAQYYGGDTLANSKVVALARVPVPPLSELGLDRFGGFERMDLEGITYLNTYFVRRDRVSAESLHFHELVHVVQWKVLGPERFLALYADGLERFGYRNSPLEVMAYGLQSRFENDHISFDVQNEVARRLREF